MSLKRARAYLQAIVQAADSPRKLSAVEADAHLGIDRLKIFADFVGGEAALALAELEDVPSGAGRVVDCSKAE
jgi:hypothetical protein